jgi:hypothetical protein
MADGDRHATIGNGLPRLAEISRAVTRGIRSLADAAGAPSFAASLADASVAEESVTYSGRKSGDLSQPGDNLMARPGRDRAAGAVTARTSFSPLAPSTPNVSATSFPQRGTPAPVASTVASRGTAYAAIPNSTIASAATSAASDQSVAAVGSVASPSLSAAARSTSSLASSPAGGNGVAGPGLALKEYPKPARNDRSGVLTWASAAPPTGRDLDRLVSEAKQRRVGWVTFVADPERMDEYGDLADRLTKAGIQPIARVQDPDGNLPAGDVGDLVKELRSHGVRYFQLFDDANVAEQTPDYRVDVPDYAQRWLAAAKAVVASGGLPGIGALAPDGDYDDLGFMRELLSEVKQRGGTDVLGQAWLALRGETPGAATAKTDVGDLASRAEWFDRVSRQAIGRSLPILATLDPASPAAVASAPSTSAAPDPSALADTAERALRDLRRKLPALFAASRGTLEAARA